MKSQTSVHLTKTVKEDARAVAKSEGLTLSVFIEQLLKREIKKARRAK